jgi:Carbohydrate phosphorylase
VLSLPTMRDSVALGLAESVVKAPVVRQGFELRQLAEVGNPAFASGVSDRAGERPVRQQQPVARRDAVGSSGKFSSDRTIAEYAANIWEVNPCLVL